MLVSRKLEIRQACFSQARNARPAQAPKYNVNMLLKDFQKQVDDWTGQFKLQYWRPHEILARLVEEMGELAREINDKFGPKKRKSEEAKKRIGDEIADILFTLACLANSLGIDLEKEFKKMMKKYQKRDSGRYRRKKKF